LRISIRLFLKTGLAILIDKIRALINSEDKKRLFSNFFSLSILQLFSYILPLLTLPYLVRVLGVDTFGLVIFAQAFIVFLNVLVDYGFNLSSTREVAINRLNQEKVDEIFSSVMTVKFFLIIVAFIFLTVITFSFEQFTKDWGLYYLTFLAVIGQALFPIWYFQGMEKMKYITIVNISSKLLFTLLIFVFIQNESDYIYVPIINGLGIISGGILSLVILRKKFNQRFLIQSSKTLIAYFKESSPFFFSRFSSVGYSNGNTLLAGLILSPTFVAYYYLADKVISVVITMFDPVIQTIYPYLSKEFRKSFFINLMIGIVGASLVIMVILYYSGDILSLLLLKETSLLFINTLNILLFLIPISLIYVMLGAPLLLARGFKKEFNNSIIFGFVIHSIILFLLYMSFLTNNVNNTNIFYMFACSLVVSKFAVLLIRLYYAMKNNVLTYSGLN
jgi:PST family polysaccharide transporter